MNIDINLPTQWIKMLRSIIFSDPTKIGIVLLALTVINLVLGIYLYASRNRIMIKYEIDYVSSIFFGMFSLTPFTLGLSAILFCNDASEAVMPLFASFVYPIIPICVSLFGSRGKGHKISRMIIMDLYVCTLLIQFVCYVLVEFVKAAKETSLSQTSAERDKEQDKQFKKKVADYIDREEMKDYYRHLNGK